MKNNLELENAARIERNEYYRKYRAANKDKIKRINENYWKRKAEKKLNEQEEVNKNA